jgi:RNA polymerase sigma factor (sigma-70 family)
MTLDNEDIDPLLVQLNSGQTEALSELWQRYGPALRRRARNRLKMRGLHMSVESMDVCQSIMLRLMKRIGSGEQKPIDNLEAYLDRALINEIKDLLAKVLADRRDRRRVAQQGLDGVDAASDDTTPSQRAFLNEVSAIVQEELHPEARQIWELRRQGKSWPEIAALLGKNPDALRSRLDRELVRIQKKRGLGNHEP